MNLILLVDLTNSAILPSVAGEVYITGYPVKSLEVYDLNGYGVFKLSETFISNYFYVSETNESHAVLATSINIPKQIIEVHEAYLNITLENKITSIIGGAVALGYDPRDTVSWEEDNLQTIYLKTPNFKETFNGVIYNKGVPFDEQFLFPSDTFLDDSGTKVYIEEAVFAIHYQMSMAGIISTCTYLVRTIHFLVDLYKPF